MMDGMERERVGESGAFFFHHKETTKKCVRACLLPERVGRVGARKRRASVRVFSVGREMVQRRQARKMLPPWTSLFPLPSQQQRFFDARRDGSRSRHHHAPLGRLDPATRPPRRAASEHRLRPRGRVPKLWRAGRQGRTHRPASARPGVHGGELFCFFILLVWDEVYLSLGMRGWRTEEAPVPLAAAAHGKKPAVAVSKSEAPMAFVARNASEIGPVRLSDGPPRPLSLMKSVCASIAGLEDGDWRGLSACVARFSGERASFAGWAPRVRKNGRRVTAAPLPPPPTRPLRLGLEVRATLRECRGVVSRRTSGPRDARDEMARAAGRMALLIRSPACRGRRPTPPLPPSVLLR